MSLNYLSNLTVMLAKPLRSIDTTLTLTTSSALRLNKIGLHNHVYLTMKYNGVHEVVRYDHVRTIPDGTQTTVVSVVRDVEGTGIYNFPVKTCAFAEMSKSNAKELFDAQLDTKQDKLKSCAGEDLASGTQIATCEDLTNLAGATSGSITDLSAALAAEVVARQAGDSNLTTSLAAEVSSRQAADARKQDKLKSCAGEDLASGTRILTCEEASYGFSSKADLVDGKVPAEQLPSYVDDVLEFSTLSGFPSTGESGKIYIAADTGKTYRWTGSSYAPTGTDYSLPVKDEGVQITPVAKSLNFVGEGVTATNSGGDITVTVAKASESASGTTELATAAETVAGTRNDVAVTPVGVSAAVNAVTDTSTSIGSVLAPTGTPSGSGTHYVTNSNGEVFMYNAATGTWVLIANGYHMSNAAGVNIKVPNLSYYRIASFTMPRTGWINLTSFAESLAENPVSTPTGKSRMATGIKVLRNSVKVYISDTNISDYGAGDGVRNSLAGMIKATAGDVIEVLFEQNNLAGANANLYYYNTQIHYLT